MFRPTTTLLTLFFTLIMFISSFADNGRELSITNIDSAQTSQIKEIRVLKEPMSGELRTINPTGDMMWKVDGWVTGNELYKNYLDPGAACEHAYPFTITEINMPMYFAKPTMLIVSIDIEDVYYSTTECPWPDSVLAISSDYQLNIAEAGLYNIWIPLDEPLTVNGPFFAGFFIGNTVDSSAGVAVLTNADTSATCQSYNIWDEQVGFVDLVNNGVWDFPGQLMLYAVGYPGGHDKRTEPAPSIAILSPCDGHPLFGQTSIWANETSGSAIIDHVDFEYSNSGIFTKIGRDFDGTSPVRSSLCEAGSGDGYSHVWDFSSLEEGQYIIRVTAYDTLGRSASDEVTVYLEPTPPTPRIIAPRSTEDFCSGFDVLMSCADEDLTRINLFHKEAQFDYSAGVHAVGQAEYALECGAPVAAACAIQLWVERGYTSLLDTKDRNLGFDSLVNDLARRFGTRENGGTTDEALYNGLLKYSCDHDSLLEICNISRPDYSTVRIQLEEEENAVLVALGGSPGMWLALDGFQGWSIDGDTYIIKVANPATGMMETLPLCDKPTGAEVRVGNSWHPVERIFTIGAADWQVERNLLGEDTDETDGWAYSVSSEELKPNHRYFLRAEGTDQSGLEHYHTVILDYDCSQCYSHGDYDGDGKASILDLAYLVDFVSQQGPEPVGGSFRADANGDSQLNVTDLVYYLNYLYGTAGPPSH